VVAEYQPQGRQAIAVQGDVSKAADVKRCSRKTKKAFGATSVLT